MRNYMSSHMYEPVVESDIPPFGHTLVYGTSESDMQPSIEDITKNIVNELPKVRGRSSNTSGLNFTCKERKDVAVGLNHIKSLDEKNMPYLEKDVGVNQERMNSDPISINVRFLNDIRSYPKHGVGCQKELLPQNHQAVDAYRKNIQDMQQQSNILTTEAAMEILKKSRVRKITDDDDPFKTSCNTERNFQGSSGTQSNYNLESEEKMPCGVAYRMK
ncbi:uncharacterized protein LOC143048961 isoform X2 [Mytilus galloprovincialis]